MIIRFYRDELECVLPQSVSLYDGEHRLIRQETPVKSSYLEWKDLDLVTEELILEFTKMPGKSICYVSVQSAEGKTADALPAHTGKAALKRLCE